MAVQDVEIIIGAAGAVGTAGVSVAGKIILALWKDMKSERTLQREQIERLEERNSVYLERVINAAAETAAAMRELTEWVKKEAS